MPPIPPIIVRLALLASIALGCAAQATETYAPTYPDPNLEKWRWSEFPFLDGRGVTCMTEHPDNVYWFGGAGSLYRYDGYEVEEYGPSSGYLGSATLCLAKSPDGALYAGSDQGLFRLEGESWQAIVASERPGRIQVRDIDFFPDGTVLVSIGEREENIETPSNWHGLALLRGDTLTLLGDTGASDLTEGIQSNVSLQASPPPPEACIQMLDFSRLNSTASLIASDGLVYATVTENNGDANKIARFRYQAESQDLQLVDAFSREHGINLDSLSHVVEDQQGKVWATSNSAVNGVCRWDGTSWEHIDISDHFPGSELFYYSYAASDGSIWIDGFGQYFVYKSGTWSKYAPPDIPLTTNNRINFFESADGAMWLIATNSKVFRLDYSNRTWTTLEGLSYQLETDTGAKYYLSLEGSIVAEESGSWTTYDSRNGLIDTPIKLFLSSYGEIWALGSHRGVAALAYQTDSGQWKQLRFPDLSWSFDHRAAFEDKSGRLYFAAAVDAAPEQSPGIIRFNRPKQDKSDQTLITPKPPVANKGSYYGIGQDHQGRIWVGGRPVVTIENNSLQPASQFSALSTYVDYIFSSPDQELWLVTRDQGILQISAEQERWHSIDTGLPSHSLISGFSDNAQDAWIALSDQIAHYDGTSWSTFMPLPYANYTRAGISLQKGSRDELHISQVSNSWTRRALSPIPATTLTVPFQTLTFHNDKRGPIIKITHFESEVSETGNTSITWQAIDYLESTPRSDIEYSYQLDDQAWTPFRKNDHQLFLGLPSGPHQLKVRARDNSFNTSPAIAAITFNVAFPVWRKLWFQATFSSLVLLVVFLWILTIKRSTRLAFLNEDLSIANRQLQLQQKTIESQNESLLQNKAHLEERVLERTKDLEKAKLRAEESDRLKSAFLSNVSHEIRTPMNAIIGFSELLMHDPPEDKEKQSFIRTIQTSGKDLLNIIDDIIEVSKIESEAIDIEYEDVSVAWILSQTQDTFRGVLARLGKENLKLLVDTEGLPDGCLLRTDPSRLKQVLKNLISNAIKFTPDGFIQLRCGPTPSRDALQFAVEDSGFGIKEEQLSLIFERFRKADPNKGHTYRGSGLGLPISQNLVQKLGGKIHVDSEPGKGSTFSFTLPWDGRTENGSEARLSPPQAVGPEQKPPKNPLLLVEDEEANVTLIARMLDRLALPFVHAATAERAIELCQRKTFSAVLMDIKLPDMQGDVAALRIRGIDPHLPIISQTAYAMSGERERFSQAPFTAYLSKPLTLENLAAALHACMRA
ncbi:ATP-binding protein [Pelagicoccus sp. SDUM812005]|uniref:hybrid sensor histidine kinase/response regulator n=1 Tax=Pelagicoccus sp. SDUM812005 TaxID=3041257 RepID=UPI00280EFC6C|nr:ATP-binding protein [Pelagicoccus sp. SDUM812005]MDQ8179790.1 ATP-binding protein [Pelagicoccus sp. SDUM812005]